MSCGTLVPASRVCLSSTGLSPSLAALSNALPLDVHDACCWPATPRSMLLGLASFPFARRYLGNRCFFLFLLLLRCFSSEGFLHMTIYSPCSDTVLPYRVSPFGNLRVDGYLLLTAAYRSLSRPSSAPDAKSFSLRSL